MSYSRRTRGRRKTAFQVEEDIGRLLDDGPDVVLTTKEDPSDAEFPARESGHNGDLESSDDSPHEALQTEDTSEDLSEPAFTTTPSSQGGDPPAAADEWPLAGPDWDSSAPHSDPDDELWAVPSPTEVDDWATPSPDDSPALIPTNAPEPEHGFRLPSFLLHDEEQPSSLEQLLRQEPIWEQPRAEQRLSVESIDAYNRQTAVWQDWWTEVEEAVHRECDEPLVELGRVLGRIMARRRGRRWCSRHRRCDLCWCGGQ